MGQLIGKNLRILIAGKIAIRPAPRSHRIDHPAYQLAYAVFSLRAA